MTERAPTAHPLTPAEMRVVELVARGMSYEQIAARLGLGRGTIKTHVTRAADKIPGDLPRRLRLINWFHGGETWRLPHSS